MSITSAEIDAVCSMVYDLCGIYLDEKKSYLIESRLADFVKRNDCEDYKQLAKLVTTGRDAKLRSDIVDAITTNETLFFRDHSPFDALRHKALPEAIDARAGTPFPNRLRIWSAACSTGQEAYSIAMTIAELIPDYEKWDIKIVGTDVSQQAVDRATEGWYANHESERGLTPSLLRRHFHQESGGWRVNDSLRRMVRFECHNLLKPMVSTQKFDIVFCRNVAIYFTDENRRLLFERLTQVMTPDGYLFVGSQENLSDLGARFAAQHHCRSVFYRPNLVAV